VNCLFIYLFFIFLNDEENKVLYPFDRLTFLAWNQHQQTHSNGTHRCLLDASSTTS